MTRNNLPGGDLIRLGDSLSPSSLDRMSSTTRRQTAREIERVQAETIIAEVREQGAAFVTNTALENAAALSALESHLIQVAPLGESRYKHIVDSYALSAARRISRGL